MMSRPSGNADAELQRQLFRHVRPYRGGGLAAAALVALAATVLVAIAWAWWATLDEVTRAPATLIASSRSQVVQVLDGGMLKELKVIEGQAVRKGELIALLDAGRATAGVEEVGARVAGIKANVARLEAEIGIKPLRFPPEVQREPELVQSQTRLMAKREQALREDLGTLNEALVLAQREQASFEKLVADGDAGGTELLRAKRQVTDLRAQMINKRNKFLADAQAELAKAREDLGQIEQSLAQRGETLRSTQLYAPADGIVKNVRVTTLGAVLRPGDELLQIVPTGEQLIVEAKVKPSDIAFIQAGLPAAVKLDTYDYTVYGSLDGVVSYVSPDTLRDETRDARAVDAVYYRVMVTLPADPRTRKGRVLNVLPGMTGTVEITTGHRTVADYLLKPLRRGTAEALRER